MTISLKVPGNPSAPARLAAPFTLITGGKGGVGKTALCASLGVHLARAGARVLACDLDLGLANLNVVLGLGTRGTIEDALAGRTSLRECVVRGSDDLGGLDVLVASSGAEHMGRLTGEDRARLLSGLDELSRDYDVVLGDSAAGIGPDVLAFAAIADRVLVVTTADLAALTDAYGLIKALDQFAERTGGDVPTPEIVVNLASSVEEAKAIAAKMRLICERFLARSPREAGWLPRSARVAAAVGARRPFAGGPPGGLEGLCLRRIAARVASRGPLPGLGVPA